MTDLRPEILTWTGLLSQWVKFAQASLAIPDDLDGSRWRASVPAIISLQAVAFALADIDRLPADEQALALDKSQILIRRSEGELESVWIGAAISPMLREIVDDAKRALAAKNGL